jgi:hypothetical protein
LTKYWEPKKKTGKKLSNRWLKAPLKVGQRVTKIGCPQDDSRRLKRQTKGQVNGCLTTDQRTNTSTAELTSRVKVEEETKLAKDGPRQFKCPTKGLAKG